MSSTNFEDLSTSVIGGWHERLAGNTSARRNHWQTKEVYFRSVAGLLASRPGRALTWKCVVTAALPLGRRSTFYEVAGAHARHRMIDDLIADSRPDSVAIALLYLRTDAVEQLIDETKVWSYWPFRQQLLTSVRTEEMTDQQVEHALARSLTAWARCHAKLAAALDHSPPACAVEDLTLLRRGRLAATRAASHLSDVLRRELAEPAAEGPVRALASVSATGRLDV
ncbi:hypothetical protein [Actinoplanes sp. ATCC 53533]|uniref:hypothetical protein n=1 Tax=Actinoplanes sp. ATCC 53533 TaxID=1288362 RepID=UPI0018F7CEAB|nr:hypothetical protein [Actinoplanes sp. ATCC 53533]